MSAILKAIAERKAKQAAKQSKGDANSHLLTIKLADEQIAEVATMLNVPANTPYADLGFAMFCEWYEFRTAK